MSQRYVQVPVSVAEEAARHLDREGYHGTATLLRDALLSQPTPTAEHKPDCDRASELSTYCDCHVEQGLPYEPESPRIEDIEPGTTITSICPRCGGSGCVGLADCRMCSGTGVVSNPAPSTIRDVTPPPGGADGG